MNSSRDWSPERVADRLQIHELLFRYCRAIDRIDLAALAGIFHEDALVDVGNYRGDPAGFVSQVGARHPGVARASHMVTNILLDFLDEDRALSESWCIALEEQSEPVGNVDRTFRVRYGDLVERRDGEWRIARRITVFDHIMVQTTHSDRMAGMTDRIWGVRGVTDPIELWRHDLGLVR